jgi:hypothetical protein
MSMCDFLECQYPLPDNFDPRDRCFQTHDTPEQWLATYVLTPEGTLVNKSTGEPLAYHGALTFYTTNICGMSANGVITRDGRAPWWAEYCALFDHGTLLKLEGGYALETSRPHITRIEFFDRKV